MKKRIVSGVLAATMVASLAACGSSKTAETTAAPATTAAAAEETTAAAEESKEAEETTAAAEEAADGDYKVNEAAAADPAVTLTMAEVNPLEGTICGQMDTKFKEAVEAISGGSITIDLQASGVLGAEQDVLDSMLGGGGDIDMSRISAFALTSYGASKSVLLSLPYVFESREHFWNFVNSDLGTEILNESEEAGVGIKGLFYGEEGFRHFFTVESKPVSSVADLKNMKIRVSNDPIMQKMVSALGANPASVSMTELYSALQTNTVDGAGQPIANYASNRFDEVGPNLTLDGHTLGAIEVVISDDSWNNKLTDNQRDVITEASKIASEYCHKIAAETEDKVLEELKGRGCNVIEVADKSEWEAACQPITDEYATGDLKDTLDQIKALA
ncbi:MAG TPA: C4-dicarboxylate ABC transporter substrate-binding protein [Oribacterium sp.]|nr:C4-dicarboxylate ABC transporter substrate-binding protein [Oribacterium sp.]